MMTSPCRAELAQIRPLRFGSCYGYSPGGASAASRRSRQYCSLLKGQDPGFLANCAKRVAREVAAGGVLAGLFSCRPVLVPVPSSQPTAAGQVTAAASLAAALLDHGLGSALWAGLWRRHPVRCSSRATPGCRPSVDEHYGSMHLDGVPPDAARLLLVDDLVTKGRTLLAASMHLAASGPQAEVEAFALMRTTSLVQDIGSILDPCAGLISWVRGDARRYP